MHKLYNAIVWTFSKLSSITFTNTTYFYNANIFYSSQEVGFKDISSPNFGNKLLQTYLSPAVSAIREGQGTGQKESWKSPLHPILNYGGGVKMEETYEIMKST
jgi:hypothetical protein